MMWKRVATVLWTLGSPLILISLMIAMAGKASTGGAKTENNPTGPGKLLVAGEHPQASSTKKAEKQSNGQAGNGIMYVALADSDLVSLIDEVTHVEIGTIDVGMEGCDFPWRASMSPSGAYVYVSCRDSHSVVVIESTGNTVVTNISWISGADDVAFAADESFAIVGSWYGPDVAIIDTSSYGVRYVRVADPARSVAVHPSLDLAYVTSGSTGNGTIQVLDLDTITVTASIEVLGEPWDVEVSPDGNWVYVSDRWGGVLSVIDVSDNSVFTTVPNLGAMTGIEVSRDGSEIYVGSIYPGVNVVDGNAFSLITTTTVTGTVWELGLRCDGDELYAGNTSNAVPVISTASREIISEIPVSGSGARGIAGCPQYRAEGLVLAPRVQARPGAPGEKVSYETKLINRTGATDSFNLTLGDHSWHTSLSAEMVGPLSDGEAIAFTVYVTVPLGAPWYMTETVVVTSTSVSNPDVYSDTASYTTQSFSPAQINIDPTSLAAEQLVNEITTQVLTITNGEGVTLTYDIIAGGTGIQSLEDTLANLNANFQDITAVIPGRYDFSEGETGTCIIDGGDDMFDCGNILSTDLGGDLQYSDNTIAGSTLLGAEGRYFTRKYPGLFVLAADLDNVDSFQISGNLGADGLGSVDGTVLETVHLGKIYYGFVKRVFSASDPSVNHLIIVPDNPSADHVYSNQTDLDSHQVFNLASGTRLYYLLYAGTNGAYINDEAALAIMETFLDNLEFVPGSTWLSANPNVGTIPSSNASPIEFTFDATDLHPGTLYTTSLIISNDPFSPSLAIPVAMSVNPTANMGRIIGTVTDSENGAPLQARVRALGEPHTITTDPSDGSYEIWLDQGQYMLEVQASGYVSETAPVEIASQGTTLQNFALVRNVPVLSISHDSISITQRAGDLTIETITLTNQGPATLAFQLPEAKADELPAGAGARVTDLVYVPLAVSDQVSIIDPRMQSEVGTIDVGNAGCEFPWRTAMYLDGSFLYISCYSTDSLVVIDTSTNLVMTTVTGLDDPDGIAFTHDGRYALIGSRNFAQLYVIDVSQHALINTISFPGITRSLAVHPFKDIAYVTGGDSTVQVFDTSTFSIITAIPVGGEPWDVAVSPDGRWVFVSNRFGDGLYVIATESNTIFTKVLEMGHINGIDVAPDGTEIYVSSLGEIYIVDGRTFSVSSFIDVTGTSWEVEFTCQGEFVYVGTAHRVVPAIETATQKVVQDIPVSGWHSKEPVACPAAHYSDVPWISLDPVAGTIPGYGSTPVQVNLNGSGLQPGTYEAYILAISNDPASPPPYQKIPVTMILEPGPDIFRNFLAVIMHQLPEHR